MEDLKFATENEALQYLADLTESKIIVAKAGVIPPSAPKEIKEVAEAWMKNAMEAAEEQIKDYEDGDEEGTRKFWKERIFVTEEKRNGQDAWCIFDNYERAPGLIYYPTKDEWYMSESGNESLIKGGTPEAKANAEIMFTG